MILKIGRRIRAMLNLNADLVATWIHSTDRAEANSVLSHGWFLDGFRRASDLARRGTFLLPIIMQAKKQGNFGGSRPILN
jgi:hypothetical protein